MGDEEEEELIRLNTVRRGNRVIRMSRDSDLISYAHAEASNMGLQKPLDIRTNPQLRFDCYRSTQFVHKIWLTNPSEGSLRHEMGHAYMSEKFPRLYKFFSKVLKPIIFLSEKIGLVGDMIYCAAFGTTLQIGILLAYTGNPLEISLPWILIGIGLGVPIVDEVLASFFGRKYRPKISRN